MNKLLRTISWLHLFCMNLVTNVSTSSQFLFLSKCQGELHFVSFLQYFNNFPCKNILIFYFIDKIERQQEWCNDLIILHVFINLKIARFLCLLKNANIILINKMQIFFKKCFYILDCVLLVYYLLYSFIVLCFHCCKSN